MTYCQSSIRCYVDDNVGSVRYTDYQYRNAQKKMERRSQHVSEGEESLKQAAKSRKENLVYFNPTKTHVWMRIQYKEGPFCHSAIVPRCYSWYL